MAFDLTGSQLAVGVTGAAAVAPLICALPGGVLADRVGRTRLIVAGQLLGFATAGATAVLATAGAIDIEHIVIAAFVIGLSSEAIRPARMALMADLVGDHLISRANALNVVGTHGSRMAAPTLAALLIGWHGPEAALLMGAAWYVPATFALHGIGGTDQRRVTGTGSAWRQFRSGTLYVLRHPVLRGLLAVTAAGNILLWPIGVGFLPVFAYEVFMTGSAGLAWMTCANGAGMIVGALALGAHNRLPLGRTFIASGLIAASAFVLFALAPHPAVAIACLAVSGAALAAFTVAQGTLVLHAAPPELRGRATGWLFAAIAMMPAGMLAHGWAAELIGARISAAAAAGLFALLLAAASRALPGLWNA